MKINFIANIIGTDGYSNHGRNLLNALINEGIDTRLETNIIPGTETQLNDKELEAVKKEEDIERINIFIGLPPNWKYYLNENKKFIGFLVWEGDKIPRFWIDILKDKRLNQVWVPSEHTKQAILNTCLNKEIKRQIKNKIRIVSHGVDINIFKEEKNKTSNKFTFVCNKGWRGTEQDRGGVQFLIKAFCEEFNKEEQVRLILKLNPAYINDLLLAEGFKKLNLNEDHAEILVNKENLSLKKINNIYNEGDCYVVTQMADAFDLGSAEAMATGIPAIMSYFGGQIEHNIKNNNLIIKKGKKIEVKDDAMYEGINWFEPSVKDIRKKLRWAFNNKKEIKSLGRKSKELIIKRFTWKHSAEKAKHCLYEI